MTESNRPQTIAIIGAMAPELGALVGGMELVQHGSSAGFEYWTGRLFERDVVIARCGMGKVAAAACVQHLADTRRLRCIVVCGLAGGLSDDLRRGDVVIGARFLQHDVDASPLFPRFELPGLGLSEFRPAPDLVAAVEAAAQTFIAEDLQYDVEPETLRELGIEAPKVVLGLIITGDQFIRDEQRESLRRDLPQALCVEMEGAAIAQVCHQNGLDFVVVRVISDNADAAAAEDFTRFAEEVAPAYTHGIVRALFPRLPA